MDQFVVGQRVIVSTSDYEPRPAVVAHLSSMEGCAWVDLEGHAPEDDEGSWAPTRVRVARHMCEVAADQTAGPSTLTWVRKKSYA